MDERVAEVSAEMTGTVAESPPRERSDGAELQSWSESRGWGTVSGRLAQEIPLTIYLDRVELATLLCTPEKLKNLVVGFLRSEGLIERLDDIALMRVCDEERVADVRLMRPREVSGRRILTSGCGGGVTFEEGLSLASVSSDLRVTPEQVLSCMKLMLQSCGGRQERGGLHVSALSDGETLLVVSRDVGRHNTLDKIWGECLFSDVRTEGKVLLTTGRISSEMMAKAAKMGVPIVVSVNSPTDRAVELAERLGITIVGYARGARLSVYSHPERLQSPLASTVDQPSP